MLSKEKMLEKYRNILVYNVYLTDMMTDELRVFNVFDNSRTFFDSCKAIEEYKKDKDLEKLKDSIDKAVKFEQWSRVQYEVCYSELLLRNQYKIDTYSIFHLNLDIFIRYLVNVIWGGTLICFM